MKPYSIGKPLPLEQLQKQPIQRAQSPRDKGIALAIETALNSPEDAVIPMFIGPDDKPATVKLAAKKMVERMDVPLFVGINSAYDERAILFSKSLLSKRGNRSKRR